MSSGPNQEPAAANRREAAGAVNAEPRWTALVERISSA
jgi:hypothetical protein